MPSAQEYQRLLQTNPYLKRFLDLIAWVEGANYNVGFGNRRIDNLSWHPYANRQFRIVDPVTKRQSTTSAAGRYQFQRGTWEETARKLGLRDFGAQSQDIAAVERINYRGALGDVLNGNIATAIGKLKIEWQGFVTKPFQSILNKFYSITGNRNQSAPNVRTLPPKLNIPQIGGNTKQNIIGDKNRYLIAFAVLAIVFIFAFN